MARATANHVVISEFATRGPSAATDEFIELYNPTSNPISIAGWKLQYKPAAGSSFSDRAILPANTTIAAHGFFLIANNTYATGATPDYTSALWGSGQGMADNGHMRILDASAVEVDKVGWGSADLAEGGAPAPNHGTSANGNSVERKATATSTADSLAAGGAHVLLGNGQDTNNNGADYVAQTHGRNPQNSSNPPEPSFAAGGNGTGIARIIPSLANTSQLLDSVTVVVKQDSAYTLTKVVVIVPSDWTWSHNASSVVLSGTAFLSASASVAGDSVIVTGAAVTTADSGRVTVTSPTTSATKGNSTFTVRTAVAGGTHAPIGSQPKVRLLELVPIVTVHVNDASGVPIAPYNIGAEATVTGTVVVNFSGVRTDFYIQDLSGGIDIFHASPPPITLNVGDSVKVTGTILQFRGLTELQPEWSLVTVLATGRPLPEPMVVTCAQVNSTFHADGTEPNESRLIRINGVTYNSSTSTITDASGTTNIFTPNTSPPSVFDVIGILKQFKAGTSPPPPYTADYEISTRSADDIIPHPGPILTNTPFEDNLQSTSVRINWTTDVASTSIVRYGLTAALGDSVVDAGTVTNHALTVPGLTPATVYYYSAGSSDVNGANFSPNALFSTASPPASTGETNVYFNKSVDASVATFHAANGTQDLPARLKTRIDNAKRSIDAAVYSMSGTVGGTIANALIAAKNRGVKIRMICEYDNSSGTGFSTVSGAGIPLINDRFDAINGGAGLMHNKFVVVDGRGGAPESVWVWTGSWNLTDPGTDSDYQNAIEMQDQALAVTYTREFNEMWGSATDTPNSSVSRFGARKLDDTPHRFAIGGHAVESYFSPSDGVNSKILAALNAAQHSLGFLQLTITRDDLAAAIIAQKNAGRGVRGVVDNNTDSGTEYPNLQSNGVDVHLKTGSGLLHHKYLIVDAENAAWNPMTLTGSHNWSSAAENSNNENTVVVHDADVTNQYLQEFVARYYQFGGTDSIHVSEVEPIGNAIPRSLSLSQNYPNPVRGRTHIVYAIPAKQNVVLRLYDVAGRELKTLVNRPQAPGTYRVEVDVHALSSGVYFYRLEAGNLVQQRKMLLLR